MKGNWTCYVLAWLLAVAAVAEASAQTGQYPTKPVQIITDSSAGSTPDVALRIVADGLTQSWKQQVLVSNHPGAGGSLAFCGLGGMSRWPVVSQFDCGRAGLR
jgi:tripartite-type tricarboxylate transporter receptor subunit TctC